MSFVSALIATLDYDRLAHDRASLKAIAQECLRQGYEHTKLLHELCDRELIDSEMVGELTQGSSHSCLGMFPRRLIKAEHLLGGGGSFPSYLKQFHDLMTPPIVKEILERNFQALPYLPPEMVSLEQVLAYFAKYFPSLALQFDLEKFSVGEIAKIYSSYYYDWKRDKYDQFDIQLDTYFAEAEKAKVETQGSMLNP